MLSRADSSLQLTGCLNCYTCSSLSCEQAKKRLTPMILRCYHLGNPQK